MVLSNERLNITATLSPKPTSAQRAARHLSKMERAKLLSTEIDTMRTAEGHGTKPPFTKPSSSWLQRTMESDISL